MKLITNPGYPKIVNLAERLGVKPHDFKGEPSILIACGPNSTAPYYAFEDVLNAVLDRLDEKVP